MATTKKSDGVPAPVEEKHGYEFLGPPGALFISTSVPFICYSFAFLCNDVSGCPAPALLHPSTLTWETLKTQIPWPETGFTGLFDLSVFLWVLGYYGLSVLLQVVLPGEHVYGTELSSGGKLEYKLNGFGSTMICIAALVLGTAVQGADFIVWQYIWDNYFQILTANLLIALAQANYVYLASFSVPGSGQPNPTKRELAKGGHSGNILYDWFIGRELNPRVTFPSWIPIAGGQTIDIKMFNEARPGFLSYLMLNMAYIAHQYKTHGVITDSIIIVSIFQGYYIFESLWVEKQMLTMMDIATDGFGFMLAVGDLVWVPFFYSIPARYLSIYPLELGFWGIAGVLGVQAVGYWIFRASNNVKDRFRQNPNDPALAHLKYIQTAQGSRLMTSSWWGQARHINYFGDWIMGFSYCLPTGLAGFVVHNYTNPVTGSVHKEIEPGEARGFGMVFTYLYIAYFGVLLLHRERRDDTKCLRKYGKDWEEYRRRVPSRIVPYIY